MQLEARARRGHLAVRFAFVLGAAAFVGSLLLLRPSDPTDPTLRGAGIAGPSGAVHAAPPAPRSSGPAGAPTTTVYDTPSGWTLDRRAVARRDGDIRAVLNRLNAAISDRDVQGYVAVADDFDPDFRGRMAAAFAALRTAPVSSVAYRWRGEWASAQVPAGLYPRPCVIAAVDRVYRLPGWDRAPVAERLLFTFMFDGDAWVLVSDAVAVSAADAPRPEPWSSGPVRVARAPGVLVIGRGYPAEKLGRLATRTAEAARAVGPAWPGSDWNGRVVVYAVDDAAFLDSWSSGMSGASGTGGAGSQVQERGSGFEALVEEVPTLAGPGRRAAAGGIRLVVSDEIVTADGAHARAVLRHEIGHLVTWTGRSTVPPTWLGEGLAEFLAWRSTDGASAADPVGDLERRGLPGAVWDGLRDPGYRPVLPESPAGFYEGSSDDVARRYSDAWLTVEYLVDHYGEPRLRRFAGLAAASGDASRALHAVYALTTEELRRRVGDFAHELRAQFR